MENEKRILNPDLMCGGEVWMHERCQVGNKDNLEGRDLEVFDRVCLEGGRKLCCGWPKTAGSTFKPLPPSRNGKERGTDCISSFRRNAPDKPRKRANVKINCVESFQSRITDEVASTYSYFQVSFPSESLERDAVLLQLTILPTALAASLVFSVSLVSQDRVGFIAFRKKTASIWHYLFTCPHPRTERQ